MSRDQVIGGLLLVVSIVIIIVYGWIVFFIPYWDTMLIKLTAFIAIAGVFGILAWIGYTLATTPPPKPIEEIEKEIETEMKNLETTEQKPSEGQQTGEKKQ